jgi:hypothetical protein
MNSKFFSLIQLLLLTAASVLAVAWTAAHALRGNIHGIGFLVAAIFIYILTALTRSSWREFRQQ